MKTYDVPQIYYGNWHDELAPGHENYWWMVGTIASWIGYALEGSIHGAMREPQFLSTIAVHQTKEKFGEVRCYCHFSDPDGVQKKYDEKVQSLLSRNEEYHRWKNGEHTPENRWVVDSYESGRYPLEIPSREEFGQECHLKDAKWYRQVYLDAVKLWPQYEKVIVGAADYWELLFKTEAELEAYFSRRVEETQESAAKYGWDDLDERLDTVEKRHQFARDVCGFKDE